MTDTNDTRCVCQRCGNYCHHQQSHCDSCREVRALREALLDTASYLLSIEVGHDARMERGACLGCKHETALGRIKRTLEETPW